jgi:predicted permease
VSIQIALSLILLIGAGLFVRTLQNLRNLDPGFNREGVLLVDIEGRRTPFPKDLLGEVERLPGVYSASISTHTPLSGSLWSEPAVPQGQPVPELDNAIFVGAGPRFFETMQIRLLSGREFNDRDSLDSPAVAIINEAYGQRHFPNQNPVGQHLSAKVRGQRRDLEIIGLVRNTNARGLRAQPSPMVYVSYAQLTGDFPTAVEIRAGGPPGQVASAAGNLLQLRLARTLDVRPLSAQVEASMVQERMIATLAGGFGVLALVLSCIGIYGLLAYSVAKRTREMGIRMALGAPRRRLIVLVLRGAIRLVVTGIVLGLPLAWAASHWAESMLFHLKPNDPATVAGAILTLTVSALAAAFVPAWRASRVDPLWAIRHE